MNRFIEWIKAFNAEWNDLPRRLLWIVIMIGCLYVVLIALPYVFPFVLAAVFAWIINPAVTAVARLFGNKKAARSIASIVFVVLLASLVITLTLLLVGRIFEEARALTIALPSWVGTASRDVITWFEGLNLDWLESAGVMRDTITDTVMRMLSDLTSMLSSTATRIASTAARIAWQAMGFLPQAIVFIVLTLMGTYYMSADKERIFAFLKGLLPEKHRVRSNMYRAGILRAVLAQLRAAMIMLLVTFGELSIGFLAMGMDYAVLLALIIAVLDALPVIGAGLFLIPMTIYGIATGNLVLAVGSGLIYVTTIVVRQLMEPRLIGRQLGLYPLATMMAMYAGLHALGFLGMLIGPAMLLLCRVALTADTGGEVAPVVPVVEVSTTAKKKGKR